MTGDLRSGPWRQAGSGQSQHPEPGSLMTRWGSLRVWLRKDLEPDLARTVDAPPPSTEGAHAVEETPPYSV